MLDFVRQTMVYTEPFEDADEASDDTDEVAAWKWARLTLPGVKLGGSLHVALILGPDLERAIATRRATNRRPRALNGLAA